MFPERSGSRNRGKRRPWTPLLTARWNQDAPLLEPHAHWCRASIRTRAVRPRPWPRSCFTGSIRRRGRGAIPTSGTARRSARISTIPIDWARMLNIYAVDYTDAQADAVARLMSDVGISIDMDYGRGRVGRVPQRQQRLHGVFQIQRGRPDGQPVRRRKLGRLVRHHPAPDGPSTSPWSWPFTRRRNSGHAVVADGLPDVAGQPAPYQHGLGGYADTYYSVDNIYGYGHAEWDYAVVDIHRMESRLTFERDGRQARPSRRPDDTIHTPTARPRRSG